jgi:hypothetical protein
MKKLLTITFALTLIIAQSTLGQVSRSQVGIVRITSHGGPFPRHHLIYLNYHGRGLIKSVGANFGWRVPPGFFFDIHYYHTQQAFKQATGVSAMGVTFTRPGILISPVHVWAQNETSDRIPTLLHEMVHAIVHASYGELPLFMDEGLPEWLCNQPRFTNNALKARRLRQNQELVLRIDAGRAPSIPVFLSTTSYAQWDLAFGSAGIGYGMGELVVGFFMTKEKPYMTGPNYRRTLLRGALAHAKAAGHSREARTIAFLRYINKNWPGGMDVFAKGADRWIRLKAGYSRASMPAGLVIIQTPFGFVGHNPDIIR